MNIYFYKLIKSLYIKLSLTCTEICDIGIEMKIVWNLRKNLVLFIEHIIEYFVTQIANNNEWSYNDKDKHFRHNI